MIYRLLLLVDIGQSCLCGCVSENAHVAVCVCGNILCGLHYYCRCIFLLKQNVDTIVAEKAAKETQTIILKNDLIDRAADVNMSN